MTRTYSARITENGRQVAEFKGQPFKAADVKGGRIAFTQKWKPEKLWDTHTPKNTYELTLALLDSGGKALDRWPPVRFGFREFWIDGRDFYLNGTRIFLSAVPLDNAQAGAAWSSYDAAKESMLRLMTFGINFVYTHNYGCEPGAHLSFTEILRAADDIGMLVALSQPHFGHYDWDAPDADEKNGYARHAEYYVRVAQNHPSVVFYSTSHNATSDDEDMNPDVMGCDYVPGWARLGQSGEGSPGGSDHQAPRSQPHRVPPLIGQFRLDSHQQFLPELGPHPGDVRLVRALVDQGREAGLHVRVWRTVHLGLGDVPRLVPFRPAEGHAGIRERQRAVGVLPGRVELRICSGTRLSGSARWKR